MSQSGRAAWSVITATAVGLSMWSLVDGATAGSSPGCCVYDNSTSCAQGIVENLCMTVNGTFSLGQVCSADNTSCREPVSGCCETDNATMCFDGNELTCVLASGGTFIENATCDTSSGASAALSGRAVGQCKLPDGGACTDPTDCESGNCVDDVCCESACDGPNEQCNLPGAEGSCLSPSTMAPVASHYGLLAAIVGLLAVGVLATMRRRTAR